jgi:hypothetical protein
MLPESVVHRAPKQVWVAFSDESSVWWLKWLRPGFRHCFAIFHDGRYWTTVDPLLGRIQIMNHDAPQDFDLLLFLRNNGLHIVSTQINTDMSHRFFPTLCTCVEVVKRLIGVHRVTIITPWQLYKFLQQQNKGS